MTWRYYLQRAVSGQWLHTDLRALEGSRTKELSGPGALTFKVPVSQFQAIADDGLPLFQKYGTKILVEDDRALRWVGLYITGNPQGDGAVSIQAAGLSHYPHRVPYEGPKIESWQPDAFDVVRTIYGWVQNHPQRPLGMVVDGHKAGLGIGDPKPPARPAAAGTAQTKWDETYGSLEPYRLAWWDQKQSGAVVDELAAEVGFDYLEGHEWVDRDNLTYRSRLRLGAPTFRRRRTDIRFVEGENISTPLVVTDDGDGWAQYAIALGAGTGSTMRRASTGAPDGALACTVYVSDPSVSSTTRLTQLAVARRRLAQGLRLDSVTVVDQGGYAPLATVEPGDEVYVYGDRTGVKVDGWFQITSATTGDDGAGYTFNLEQTA